MCICMYIRYVHYEVDQCGISDSSQTTSNDSTVAKVSCSPRIEERPILFPPQWIQCDLRFFDMSLLGKWIFI